MKKILLIASAALLLAGPITSASAQQSHQGQSQAYGADQDRRAERDESRSHRDNRESWRDDRREARWDATQYNGYYQGNRWTYGPPPSDRYGRGDFALGYRPWSNGQSLGYYNHRFTRVDYRAQNLARPQWGLSWVRDDRGDFLLVDNVGRIHQVVVSGNRPHERRQAWRDNRADARWDHAQHNGYYQNSRWTYGPPAVGARNVSLGYRPWARGERLGYYNGRYREVDYRTRNLRQPPRGYHWVQDDDGGDLLLAAIVGGLIAQVIFQ